MGEEQIIMFFTYIKFYNDSEPQLQIFLKIREIKKEMLLLCRIYNINALFVRC